MRALVIFDYLQHAVSQVPKQYGDQTLDHSYLFLLIKLGNSFSRTPGLYSIRQFVTFIDATCQVSGTLLKLNSPLLCPQL